MLTVSIDFFFYINVACVLQFTIDEMNLTRRIENKLSYARLFKTPLICNHPFLLHRDDDPLSIEMKSGKMIVLAKILLKLRDFET